MKNRNAIHQPISRVTPIGNGGVPAIVHSGANVMKRFEHVVRQAVTAAEANHYPRLRYPERETLSCLFPFSRLTHGDFLPFATIEQEFAQDSIGQCDVALTVGISPFKPHDGHDYPSGIGVARGLGGDG